MYNPWADLATRYPDRAAELGVDDEEIAAWRDAAAAMHIPYDEELGVHPQSEGFTRHQEWDFANTPQDHYPLLLHYPYFDLYRKQVIKQADLVFAMYVRGDAFTHEQKVRNFAYYEQRTVRDSSLSASVQAVMAAEVGDLELAHDYLGETALLDLYDIAATPATASTWRRWPGRGSRWSPDSAACATTAGTVVHAQVAEPHQPSGVRPAVAREAAPGGRAPHEVTYALGEGDTDASIDVLHHGEPLRVTAGAPITRPIPPAPPPGPPFRQPYGRAPARRSAKSD